jgi:amicyanin
MRKAILSTAAAVVLVCSLGSSGVGRARAAAGDQDRSPDKHTVKIDNFNFNPATLTVPVGTKVTWINRDDVPHMVVAENGKDIKSPVLDTDQKFSYAFTKAGTYRYYCSMHPRMTGKVIVR